MTLQVSRLFMFVLLVDASIEAITSKRIGYEQKATIQSQRETIHDLRAIIEHGRKRIRERSDADGAQWERMNTLEETGP